ncbi:MAG: hypothetical protein V4472_19525 [Pseudomonadota bacterium]
MAEVVEATSFFVMPLPRSAAHEIEMARMIAAQASANSPSLDEFFGVSIAILVVTSSRLAPRAHHASVYALAANAILNGRASIAARRAMGDRA